MRTSRISRDTARALAASRAQHPVRHLQAPSLRESGSRAENELSGLDSGSELSSVPELSSEGEAEWGSRKRKRGKELGKGQAVKSEAEEVSLGAIASPDEEYEGKRGRGKGAVDGGVKTEASPVKKKMRRAPVKKGSGVKYEPPPHWEEVYTLTREMRNENVAPVDTMGCECLADRSVSPRDQRFQTLVALMLSSQTKDTVTAVAMKGMQDNMPGVCISLVLTIMGTDMMFCLGLQS